MTPIVNDAYRLRKLLEKATGVKVYKSDLLSNYFNCYLSITQEYKNETNPHITVAQGNLDTEEQVSCMLLLIQKKLSMSVEQASDFMRNAIGINA